MEKRRSPLAAVLLSLLEPGLGQLYCGRPGWALFWWLLMLGGLGWFLVLFAGMESSLALAYYPSAAWLLAVWLGAAVQAGYLAAKAGQNFQLRFYHLARVYLLCWIAGLLLPVAGLVRLTRSYFLSSLVFLENTMLPELMPGDVLTIDRRSGTRRNLQRWQIAAVAGSGPASVSAWRVIGLVGERVELLADGLQLDGRKYPCQEGEERVFYYRDERGQWQEKKARECLLELEGRRIRWWLEPQARDRKIGAWQVGPGEILLSPDNLAAGEPRLYKKDQVLGRVIMVRISRDPRSRQWRPERRRLAVP